jgi:hypothetical protein
LEIDPTRPIACDQGHDIILLTNTKFTRNKPFPIQKCTWESTIANQKKNKGYEKERSMTVEGEKERNRKKITPVVIQSVRFFFFLLHHPLASATLFTVFAHIIVNQKGGK